MNSALDRTATSTCTAQASSTVCVTVSQPEISFLDFVFVSSIIIFCLSIGVWRVLFSPFGKNKMTQ
jgi:hypothetical protein